MGFGCVKKNPSGKITKTDQVSCSGWCRNHCIIFFFIALIHKTNLSFSLLDFSCALSREILLQGRIYVSQGWVCFYSNIFGWETQVWTFVFVISLFVRVGRNLVLFIYYFNQIVFFFQAIFWNKILMWMCRLFNVICLAYSFQLQVTIDCKKIQSITREKTAYVVPNAILICTEEEKVNIWDRKICK